MDDKATPAREGVSISPKITAAADSIMREDADLLAELAKNDGRAKDADHQMAVARSVAGRRRQALSDLAKR